MADNQTTQSKNTLQKSKVKAGGNVHIGDVNVTIQPAEKKRTNLLITVIAVVVLLLLLLVAYRYTHPPVPENPAKETVKIQEEPIKKAGLKKEPRPEKKQGAATVQFDNNVAGIVTYLGAGIPNILVSTATGKRTMTDSRGYFRLNLNGTSQISSVRLYFTDTSSFYEPINYTYQVPDTQITLILQKNNSQ